MRVLVASTGGAGHYLPLVPFVDALVQRRVDMLLVVPPSLAAMVDAAGYPHRVGAEPPEAEMEAIRSQLPTAPALSASILGNRELFGRLCSAAMLPAMGQAIDAWRPDLVLREPCEYASAVAAERRGLPHAQVAISQAQAEEFSIGIAAPALERYGSGVVASLRNSPYLSRLPASLDPSPFPTTLRFRQQARPPLGRLPDWWGGSEAPLVYMTFGSVTGGLPIAAGLFRSALDAVAGLGVRVLVTLGRQADAADLGSIPANVHVEAWVHQTDVLVEADLVVCHGGSGTTFGALAAGVPLVVVPLFADQPANGQLVADSGAGLVVGPEPGTAERRASVGPELAPRIAEAVEAVLAGESFARAAGRLAAEMEAQPTISELLDVLEAGFVG